MSDAKPTAKKATKKEAKKPVVKVSIEILEHKTKIGAVICAKGARISVDSDKAEYLESKNLAKIIGVQ